MVDMVKKKTVGLLPRYTFGAKTIFNTSSLQHVHLLRRN